jgi:hypothetical protein
MTPILHNCYNLFAPQALARIGRRKSNGMDEALIILIMKILISIIRKSLDMSELTHSSE